MTPDRIVSLDDARQRCPKRMVYGPCGGVRAGGGCEVDDTQPCPYLKVLETLPWRRPRIPKQTPRRYTEGKLEATLHAKRFAVIAEAYTPDSADLTSLVQRYATFGEQITAVNIAEHALATPHASTLAAAALFERAGIEAIVNLTCRDRNQIALQGEILGAAALGVKNIFCVTGDHPALGDHPEATGVFDLDAFGLIRLARDLRDQARLLSGRRLEQPPRLLIGAAANPFSPPVALQAERVAAKVAAGANFIQTQALFDLPALVTFIRQLENFGALARTWFIAGVAVIGSLEEAHWLARNVPGARVPERLMALLERTPASQRQRVGVQLSLDLIHQLRGVQGVSGVLLFPLLGNVDALAELIETLKEVVP